MSGLCSRLRKKHQFIFLPKGKLLKKSSSQEGISNPRARMSSLNFDAQRLCRSDDAKSRGKLKTSKDLKSFERDCKTCIISC